MALSIDLRKRVIGSVDNGVHIDEVAKNFQVSRRVIYKWLKLRAETNSLEPKSGYQKGHSHKIKDWDEFKKFVEANKYHTARTMIVEWEKLNNNTVSEAAMGRWLKKINYTSKKKLFFTQKQMLKSESNF